MIDLDTDWSLVDFEKPSKPEKRPVSVKGTCPKCGKHIGRGVHFHAQACDA